MQTIQNRNKRRLLLVGGIIAVVFVLLVVAYLLSNDEDTSNGNTDVTLFMSYVPSVQFAPAYVAAERGYFADEGIDIEFEHNFNENDGVERIANNDLRFGIISGEQVLLARANSRPLVYVFEWYHRFPVGIVSPADADISEPDDLANQVVGVPGPYGASYIGLRALLSAAGLAEGDLEELRSIGFSAPENVCEREVDAAVVYIANEPLTIETDCFPVNVIEVSDYADLVSNGLVTNETTVQNRPELVRGMVRALQRGVADVIADPDSAFEMVVPDYVPDLPENQYATQRQVLYNSVSLWFSEDLGRTNPDAWETTEDILVNAGLLDNPLDDLAACYDMEFLPEEAPDTELPATND